MDNERLILMLNAIRLELRNLTLQSIAANAIAQGGLSNELLGDAVNESAALVERSDRDANTALGHIPR